MIRIIIKIDENKCNGCSLCATACHEGAIGLFNGKAKLPRDDYCDGLGDCLPICMTEAITFEEREAAEYDETAVKANMANKQRETLACGCSGTHSKSIMRDSCYEVEQLQTALLKTHLIQWPVQIKLVPANALYFDNADLLIAADCTAYTYGNFHNEYMKNKITVIGCPKLDDSDYSEKFTVVLKQKT